MRVTITQIAEAAGVSRGTVDKVLHNRPGISESVRTHVMRIVKDMDYHPNKFARTLRCAKTTSITLLIPPVNNLYHRAVFEGAKRAEENYRDEGLQLATVFLEGHDPGQIIRNLEQLQNSDSQGIILQGIGDDRVKALINQLCGIKKSVVLYDSDVEETSRVSFVGEDHILSGKIAGSLLAKSMAGTGDVLVVGGSTINTGYILRLEGFLHTLKSRYPGLNPIKIVETDEDNEVAYSETIKAITEIPNLKGIFVATGCSAGVARAVIETKMAGEIKIAGYNITEDVAAVIKLGIVDFAINISPYQQGYIATRELFFYLANGNPMPPKILIPCDIGISENIDLLISNEINKTYKKL